MAQDTASGPVNGGKKPVAEAYKAPAGAARMDMRGPVAAVVVVGGFLLLTAVSDPAKPGAVLPWTLNPTGYLTIPVYFGLYFFSVIAKEVANGFLLWFGANVLRLERMDEGEGKVRKLEVLEAVDLTYLALNTTVEYIGMNHILAFLCLGAMPHRLREFTVFNGPLAFVLVMLINDIIYYPFHLVAHRRAFYPYCHKQHHRQFVPFRGYADAANQHPLEQMYGFSIFIVSLHFANQTVGVHAGTAWTCFIGWAVLNICNHLAFNSTIHLPLPYPAYPRDHQMHHRFPQCNYSTLTSMCDRAAGTFRAYKALGEPIVDEKKPAWYETKDPYAQAEEEAEEAATGGRPEAVPSPKSVVGWGVALVVATLIMESFHLDWAAPALSDYVHYMRAGIVVINAAVVCAATESANSAPVKKLKRMYMPKGTKLAEAVPEGHVKSFRGGKDVWKPDMEPIKPKAVKRE